MEKGTKRPVEAADLCSDSQTIFKKLRAHVDNLLQTAEYKEDESENKLQITDVMIVQHVRRYAEQVHKGKDMDYKYNETESKLNDMIKLRKRLKLDSILSRPWAHDISEEKILGEWPMFSHGRDEFGHPIMWNGKVDLTKLKAMIPEDQHEQVFRDLYFRYLERIRLLKRRLSDDSKMMTYKHIMVMDLDGIGIWEAKKYKSMLGALISDAQLCYPDTLLTAYLVNTNWLFRAVWAIVCLFIDDITQKKIRILNYDFIGELTKGGIPEEEIPAMFKGKMKGDPVLGNDSKIQITAPDTPTSKVIVNADIPAPPIPNGTGPTAPVAE